MGYFFQSLTSLITTQRTSLRSNASPFMLSVCKVCLERIEEPNGSNCSLIGSGTRGDSSSRAVSSINDSGSATGKAGENSREMEAAGESKGEKKAMPKERRGRHQQEYYNNSGLSPQRCHPLLLRQGYKIDCGGVRHNGVCDLWIGGFERHVFLRWTVTLPLFFLQLKKISNDR